MARSLTTDQKNLLRSPDLACNALATFYLDEGTYRFCDHPLDLYNGVDTFIGASALSESVDIKSGSDLAAQEVTLLIDGNRMTQYGIEDPASVLRDILTYLHQQRRVDIALGFRYSYSMDVNLTIPVYAGKINSCRLIDQRIPGIDSDQAVIESRLEITLDALAMRYSKATLRTRSHQDQLEIDPTDNFFSFTLDATLNEAALYWGKERPRGIAAPYSGGVGGIGGINIPRLGHF